MSVESYILRLQKEKNPGVGGTLILGMLSALETLYRRGVISRRQKEMAGAETASIPVISVGNMTAGGTGKTPCIIRLTGMLKQSGHRPVIGESWKKTAASYRTGARFCFLRKKQGMNRI